jgi:YVTN family beta-propeller protein
MNLRKTAGLLLSGCLALLSVSCSKPAAPVAEEWSAYRIYVTNETSGDMSIIDSATLNVVHTIPLGKRPRGIVASPDNKTIYVALSGSPIAGPGVDESKLPPPDKSADGIGVFDVAQNKLVRVIKSGSDPENFDISEDGRLLYVSNEDAAGLSILDIDAGRVIETIATGEEPEGVQLTPDGKYVYVTSEEDGTVAVVDTATRKDIKTVKVGRRPRSIAFLPNGSRAYVTCENDGAVVLMDVTQHEVMHPIPIGQPGVIKPMAALMSADGSTLYVSTGRGKQVFIIDTATNKVTASVEVGARPWGIALSPDGKTLYSANGPSNDVSVVDLANRSVTKKIQVTGSPWGVLTLERARN